MIDTPITPGALTISFSHITGIGGRESNQDALASAHHGDMACYVVADGTGGHQGGEVASAIVVKSVIDAFRAALDQSSGASSIESILQSCIEYAAVEVARGKTGHDHLQSMSATVAAVLIDTGRCLVTWAHLGDTRVYLFREGRLLHVTKDHSLVQQFIDAGLVESAEMRTHPQRNLLYAAVGVDGDVPPAIQSAIALQNGDAILICTDGLWEWITEDEMEHCLSHAADVDSWLAALCAAADKSSAASGKMRDNFTAQALWIHTGRGTP